MKTYLGTYFFQKAFVEYFRLWENYDDGPVMYQTSFYLGSLLSHGIWYNYYNANYIFGINCCVPFGNDLWYFAGVELKYATQPSMHAMLICTDREEWPWMISVCYSRQFGPVDVFISQSQQHDLGTGPHLHIKHMFQ